MTGLKRLTDGRFVISGYESTPGAAFDMDHYDWGGDPAPPTEEQRVEIRNDGKFHSPPTPHEEVHAAACYYGTFRVEGLIASNINRFSPEDTHSLNKKIRIDCLKTWLDGELPGPLTSTSP